MATGDPNVYPGTSILRNLRGIRDPEELERFEAMATAGRILQLQERPITGGFDRSQLQAIHRHIFQDVHPWGGELRDVDIAKPGSPFFARPPFIAPALDELAGKMRAESYLQGLDSIDFALRAGHYLGEINAVHPFREGNGRAQREFIRELAEAAGYRIDWSHTSRELMYHASALRFERGDASGLAALSHDAIAEPPGRHTGPDVSSLPVFEPATHELVDRREDFTLNIAQMMRVLGRLADGGRVLGRCGAGILSVARTAFLETPHVDQTVTLSRASGRDVAQPVATDLGLER